MKRNGRKVAIIKLLKVEIIKWRAKFGHVLSQFRLAEMYRNGAYDYGILRDIYLAEIWYQRAGQQDYAPAELRLADIYYYCDGTSAEQAKAISTYQKLAQQDNVEALSRLVTVYQYGKGVQHDREMAIELCWKIIELDKQDGRETSGHIRETLGLLYIEKGEPLLAISHLEAAAKKGYSRSAQLLSGIDVAQAYENEEAR